MNKQNDSSEALLKKWHNAYRLGVIGERSISENEVLAVQELAHKTKVLLKKLNNEYTN